MSDPLILSLEESRDSRLVGGKAASLATLIAAGFSVPRGLCVTTAVYHLCLEAGGIDETALWKNVRQASEEQRAREQAKIRDLLRTGPGDPRFQAELDRRVRELAYGPSTRWAVRSSATNEDTAETSAAGLYRTTLGLSQQEVFSAIRDCWISLWQERVFQYLLRSEKSPFYQAMAVVIQPMLDAKVAGEQGEGQ